MKQKAQAAKAEAKPAKKAKAAQEEAKEAAPRRMGASTDAREEVRSP